jgi:hypothetical protein
MNGKYEIVTFERYTPGSRVADRSIITGLSGEDVVTRLNKASVKQHPTDANLAAGKHFHYHDHEGKLCRLTRISETEA